MKRSIQKIMVWPLCLFLFIGVVIIGNFDTICIGGNGQVEFETECLPCCDKTTDICQLETENDFHEHDSCHDCSDLSMDGPLWSKRITKKSLLHSDKLLSVPTIHNNVVHIVVFSKGDESRNECTF